MWCQKFHWVERAGAYDEIVDKQRRRAFAERYRKLQDMRSRFEIDDQPRFEKLVQNIDSVLQRAGTAPLSEVTQVKYDKVTGKKTTTKIRSVDMPGIAALAKARIQVARQAALRAEPKDVEREERIIDHIEWVGQDPSVRNHPPSDPGDPPVAASDPDLGDAELDKAA